MKKVQETENTQTVEQEAPKQETQTVEQEAPVEEQAPTGRALTFDEMMDFQSINDQVDAINETKICGMVVKINDLPPSEKTDKKGQKILDEHGQPTLSDPMYWVNIGITGSDDGCVVSAEQLNELEEGKKYIFVGYRKDRKFRVTKIISKRDYVSAIARKRFGI